MPSCGFAYFASNKQLSIQSNSLAAGMAPTNATGVVLKAGLRAALQMCRAEHRQSCLLHHPPVVFLLCQAVHVLLVALKVVHVALVAAHRLIDLKKSRECMADTVMMLAKTKQHVVCVLPPKPRALHCVKECADCNVVLRRSTTQCAPQQQYLALVQHGWRSHGLSGDFTSD